MRRNLDQRSSILEIMAELVTTLLAENGFTVAEPVTLESRIDDTTHNTGFEVTVRLTDATNAEAAEAVILAKYGDDQAPIVVNVS